MSEDNIPQGKPNRFMNENARTISLLIIVGILIWSLKDYYVYYQTRDVMAEKDEKIAELNNIIANTYCMGFKDRVAELEKEYKAARNPAVPPANDAEEQEKEKRLAAIGEQLKEQGTQMLKCIGR